MTTYSSTFNSPSDLATLQTWGSEIKKGFTTGGGMSQTSDLGQVDWATVAYPASTGLVGYEVYALSDTLQPTRPIFLRVEYHFNTSSTTFYITVRIGTSTNGLGTITSGISNMITLMCWTPGGYSRYTVARPMYASGDGSSMAMALGHVSTQDLAPGAGWFYLDRTRDANGDPNGEGALFGGGGAWGYTLASQSNGLCAMINFDTGGVQTFTNGMTFPGAALPQSLSAARADEVGFTPGLLMTANKWHFPPLVGICMFHTDVAPLSIFTVTFNGAPRTFIALGGFAVYASVHGTSYQTYTFAMRYE